MALDGELIAELAYLRRVRAALARMLDHARMRVATGEAIAGDRYTSESLGTMLKTHAKELAGDPDGPLYFGRLGFGDGPEAGDHRGQRYYIGRRRITGEGAEPLVVDWRAPVSSLFYRASASSPRGVAVRRRYGWTRLPPAELTGFEDERLDRGEELSAPGRLLTEEIERPRVGPMRDIVATIQPEQDELVRAGPDRSLCVQGGPGTGKTAVGLHRAAYLLYANRRRLSRTGVLVVGPNESFLSYIAAVLPALGEVDVRQRTVESLLSETPPTGTDSAATAALKHDPRMAEVLRRALYGLITEPRDPAEARELAIVLSEDLPFHTGRERLRTRLPGAACWPRARPTTVLTALLSDAATLDRAADGILTPEERSLLLRPRRNARWSPADLVLLDEIAGLIEHPAGFGHIVVDEAQDLSPMQCRVLARRSRHGSLTVLGDLAQGTTPWAAGSWPEQMAHLGVPGATVTALTTGFRVPAAVLSFANRLLPVLRADVPDLSSVRRDGALTIQHTPDLTAATAARVAAALTHEGSIAVIATAKRLSALGIADDRVTLVPATEAKGLEFDHVLVVEPAEIAEAEPRGLRRLYVVLTRAVTRLDVLHDRPLPPALIGEPGPR